MPSAIIIWIWFCAYLNGAGWTLSALHQLNEKGYAAALALGLATVWIWKTKTGARIFPDFHAPKLRRRFKRIFPLAFLILAGLAFFGGALHAPSNFDTLAYRTPRVLHWLAAQQWEWVHTDFPRLNTRTAGFEWLTAPQFLFLHTDRLVFLLNVISFLLLPGRVFAVLTRLGVRPRAAWHWMWLFPSGYGYVLQAGSVVNDMFGAVFALTAVEFALRAAREKKIPLLWTAGLAAALMTAIKAFNIVLLLPWAIAALPAWQLLLRRPAASFAVILLAASASILPTAALNWRQCRDWTGLKMEQPTIGGGGKSYRFLANAADLPLANLAPPIFPFTPAWEQLVARVVPPELSAKLQTKMEKGLATFRIPEMQVEESAGLGVGVTLLLLVVLAKKIRAREVLPRRFWTVTTLVPLAAWASLGILMMETGAAGPARYLLPFYLLLAAPILTGTTAGKFFQNRFWRGASLAVFAVAGLLLIFAPAHPVWPASTVLRALDAERSPNHWLQRAWNVYSVYDLRADGFAPVIAELPPEVNLLGYMAFDEPEAGLWRPFGPRRILHICYADSAADIRARGIKFALVSERFLEQHQQMKPAEWLQRMNAEIVRQFDLKLLAGQPPHRWLLIRLQ
jgi:hypothetical protein